MSNYLNKYRDYEDLMPNRTLCDVLNEMRKAEETKNFSYLKGLIEEAQMMGNRMEARLWDQKDFEHRKEEHALLKEEIKKLKEEKKALTKND